MEPGEGWSFEAGASVQDLASFVGEARGLPVELDLAFREKQEEFFAFAGEYGGVRDFGFLMVVPVGEDRPFVILVLQGIVPVFQRVVTGVEGFQASFEVIGAGFKGAKAVNEVIPHPQGNRDCGVEVRLGSK